MSRLVTAPDGTVLATYVDVVTTSCGHCHQQIGHHERFAALAAPFCCCMHMACMPFFDYTQYPHASPIVAYR